MQVVRMKYCPDCTIRKPESGFYRTTRGYLMGHCKACNLIRKAQWRKENPEKRKSQHRKDNIEAKHGIPGFLYDVRLARQGYECAICSIHIEGKNAHLDHDHVTGKLRDFLCSNCNTSLGGFKDSPELLQKAIAYLEKHNEA